MKECSLHDFIKEMKPWLNDSYIQMAQVDDQSRFTLYFVDGTRNVYQVDDCNRSQIVDVLKQLQSKGIKTVSPDQWNTE